MNPSISSLGRNSFINNCERKWIAHVQNWPGLPQVRRCAAGFEEGPLQLLWPRNRVHRSHGILITRSTDLQPRSGSQSIKPVPQPEDDDASWAIRKMSRR